MSFLQFLCPILAKQYADPDKRYDFTDKDVIHNGNEARLSYIEGNTGFLPLTGGMYNSLRTAYFREGITPQLFVSQANALANNPTISHVVLLVSSPGGDVDAMQLMANAVRNVKAKGKKVIAYAQGPMASAAYYVSLEADYIAASPLSFVGSVGSMTLLLDASEALKAEGMKEIAIYSGKDKFLGSPESGFTEENIASIQKMIDAAASNFFTKVRASRPAVTNEQFNEIKNGGVHPAEAALSLNLIDAVTSLETIMSGITAEQQLAAALQDLAKANEKIASLSATNQQLTEIVATATAEANLIKFNAEVIRTTGSPPAEPITAVFKGAPVEVQKVLLALEAVKPAFTPVATAPAIPAPGTPPPPAPKVEMNADLQLLLEQAKTLPGVRISE